MRTGRNYCRGATTNVLIGEGQEYETNIHDFHEEGNVEDELDDIWEANVMNQQDPKTGRYLGNKSTGFKKDQNQKHQVNEMQGTHSRACMDHDTWNSLEESDKKAWDGLSDKAKTKITGYHFNKGKDYASQGSEVNKMEAKEHNQIFDESDDEEEEQIEVSKCKVTRVSNAEFTRKMHEDKGINFDDILQAQQANTCLQAYQPDLLDSDSSHEESVTKL